MKIQSQKDPNNNEKKTLCGFTTKKCNTVSQFLITAGLIFKFEKCQKPGKPFQCHVSKQLLYER